MAAMHQIGITCPTVASSRFVAFAVVDEVSLRKCVARIPDIVGEVSQLGLGSALTATVALSAGLFVRLGRATPPQLKAFVPLVKDAREMPSTQADLLLHINGERRDLCFELLRRVRELLGAAVDVVEDVDAFRYLDERDLTGFIDGTENPEGEERVAAALTGMEQGEFAEGSYVLAQRYEHHLARFAALTQAQQERVFGRTKPDSVELVDKPEDAHISRVVIEEDGEELEIVRHSLPYGDADVAGLFFLAYCKDLTTFEKMLARMMGVEGDGKHDRLLGYTSAKSGHFFFAPSVEYLRTL